MGVNVCQDTFNGRAEGGNNGAARIVWFMDFGKEVKGWGANLGLRRRDKSSLDRLGWTGSGEEAGQFRVKSACRVEGCGLVAQSRTRVIYCLS